VSRQRAKGEKEVSLGPCQCPNTPHDEDTAWFPESLDPWDANEATAVIFSERPQAEVEREVSRIFLRQARWNCLGDDGEPLAFDDATWESLSIVANAASHQYTDELMAPFQRARQKS
jgi:hypothetical protein